MTERVKQHRRSLRRGAHAGRKARPARRAIGRGLVLLKRRRWIVRSFWAATAVLGVCLIVTAGLWWRLNSGPIEFDAATPWLKAAIERNFGPTHTVSVGGTQIERDEKGRTSLRLLNVVVRDADGTAVASAPKAEIGLSGSGLFSGHLIAQSLNLVGAEMSVRIEKDGRLTVFAGADKRPIVSAAVPTRPAPSTPAHSGQSPATSSAGVPAQPGRDSFEELAAVLAWIDNLGETGLDGQDLREIGLKGGRLTVDDRRNNKEWTFDHINVGLTRPNTGGLMFKIESDNQEHPWIITAAIRPLPDGARALGIEARQVSSRDLMLALRLNEGGLTADLPLSASVRAEIAPDGTPQAAAGELVAEAGTIRNPKIPDLSVPLDRTVVRFNWDIHRHTLLVPFQIRSGGNQFTLRATAEPPKTPDGAWLVSIGRDDPVIDPAILAPPAGSDEETLALNRVNMKLRIDPRQKRIELEQADLRHSDARPAQNVGIALNGSLDFSGEEPRLAFGIAGTRMPMWATIRLWPTFVTADVRRWVIAHMSGGTVERLVIAGNAPLQQYVPKGPPMPADGLSIEAETSGTLLQPVGQLPPIRDADLSMRITGQTAAIDLGRGSIEVGGRKLNIANGMFRIADTHLRPSPSHTNFRLDGALPAIAALLSSDGLRDNVGLALDPAGMRGAVSAEVSVDLPIGKDMPENAVKYAISADLTNFGADKLVLGHKLEAASLKVTASNSGYQIAGDAKLNGMPAKVEFVKTPDEPQPELHIAATLDDAARRRFGFDLGNGISGPIPIRLSARVAANQPDLRVAVDADLTPVRIDDLVPGWNKAPGKSAHASFTLVKAAKAARLENLDIEGGGANLKGSIDLDASGGIASADLPTFSLSDRDKASLKAERGNDGMLHVTLRGEVYDGRDFLKSSLGGAADGSKQKQPDVDLDIKIGTVAGHNGETLRGLALKMTRKNGRIRSFNLESKIGRDATLLGDMRVRARDNHPVIFFETADAGALFRFTDFYPRMFGGKLWVAMDPPGPDAAPEQGTLNVQDFVVRNEPALQRILANGADGKSGIDFTELHADFSKYPGRMSIRDGVVRGPAVGITVEGQIDYTRNDAHLRGTFVPFYGLNNVFGQIPIVGLFLGGGSNEGLVGITYEATGPPSAPHVVVNPVTAITPGVLRKFVPSPGMGDPNFLPPQR